MTTDKSAVLLCTCGRTLRLDYDLLKREIQEMDLTAVVAIHDLVCQEDGLAQIEGLVDEYGGRLVIAACTSQKIRPRIEQYLRARGKDPSQIQYINIREHSAWVHSDQDEASKKSTDMIRGVLALSGLSVPLTFEHKEVPAHVTVIGGGIAGIESALSLSKLGYDVALIELSEQLGGHVISLPLVTPTGRSGKEVLSGRLQELESTSRISVMTNTRVKFVEGEMGNFTVHYAPTKGGEEKKLKTSGIVLAMGFQEFKPTALDEFRYGKNPNVVTQFELSCMLSEENLSRPSDGQPIREVVMVQCVGSRSEDYKRDCSKLCCTFAIDNALEIVKRVPDAKVRIIYMDIRVPFENEIVYKESREKGVDYIRGRVSMVWERESRTWVRFYDSLLNRYFGDKS